MALTKLTAEQLARLRSWWGAKDPYAIQYVSEDLWEQYGDDEWRVSELIEILQEHLKKLPEAERATARIKLNGGYEGGGSLTLSYTREKTDEEKQLDIDRALAWLRECDEKDAANYERLKAKFGS